MKFSIQSSLGRVYGTNEVANISEATKKAKEWARNTPEGGKAIYNDGSIVATFDVKFEGGNFCITNYKEEAIHCDAEKAFIDELLSMGFSERGDGKFEYGDLGVTVGNFVDIDIYGRGLYEDDFNSVHFTKPIEKAMALIRAILD